MKTKTIYNAPAAVFIRLCPADLLTASGDRGEWDIHGDEDETEGNG